MLLLIIFHSILLFHSHVKIGVVHKGRPQNLKVLVPPPSLSPFLRFYIIPPPPYADVCIAGQNHFSHNSNNRPCTKRVENIMYISPVVQGKNTKLNKHGGVKLLEKLL